MSTDISGENVFGLDQNQFKNILNDKVNPNKAEQLSHFVNRTKPKSKFNGNMY